MPHPDKCIFDPHDESREDLRDFLLREGPADPTRPDRVVDHSDLERLLNEAARNSTYGDLDID